MAALYEYAVIKHEKLDADGEVVEKAVLLVEPTTVLAKNEKSVGLQATKQIPDEELSDDNVDRIEVVIRPFGA